MSENRPRRRTTVRIATVLAATLVAVAGSAAAQETYAPETFHVDKCIPPLSNQKYYRSPPGQDQLHRAHQKWGQAVYRKPSHKRFQNCQQPSKPSVETQSVHTFSSLLEGEFSIDGGLSFMPLSVETMVTVLVTFDHMEGDTEVYDNEMVMLDVPFMPFGMKVRESPVMASVGVTTIRPVAGGYMISSFFDVFAELSADGGATWIPSLDETLLPLAGHVALTDVSPTATETQALPRQFLYVPNPLQRGAPIRWSIAHTGPVRVDVFDVGGRQVGRLSEGGTSVGERTHLWTGDDLHGRPLGAGVYVFRMTTRAGQVTSKAVYTR